MIGKNSTVEMHALIDATRDFGLGRTPKSRNLGGQVCVLALVVSGVLGARASWAQQVGPAATGVPAPEPSAQSSQPAGLEEIIVTANKRRENVQKVPITIDVVRADQLAAAGIQSTDALTSAVPGLQFQTSQNGFNVHLRGVGISTIPPGNENSVSTYVDGVYIASLSGGFLELNNIEQVEVDKGPQGTLFGRNATGGVISITTKNPVQDFGGTASLSYGSYNTVATNTYITGGITDTVAADFAAHYSHQGDGYGKNLFNGQDVQKTEDLATRTKWLFTPTDADKLTLSLDYERTDSSVYDAFQPVAGHPTNWGPGAPQPTGQPFTFSGGPWDTNVTIEPVYTFEQGGASLNAQHEFDFARLESITAYRQADKFSIWSVEPIPTPAEIATWDVKDRQLTEELQLSSREGSTLKWVAGLFFMDATTAIDPLDVVGSVVVKPPLQNISFHSVETTLSGAAFGQATTPVPGLDDTNLTMGVRYTEERRGVHGEQTLNFIAPLGSIVKGPVDTEKTFEKTTWRLSLDHEFTDDVTGYISYNRGFKSGVYGTIPVTLTPVNPEVIDAYEAGLKTDFLDHKLRLNAAAFYYNYSQIQVSVSNRTSVILMNGAGAEIYGLDLDLESKITDYLTVTAGAEALHDEFTSFQGSTFFIPQSAAQGGGNLLVVADAAGKQLPNTPNYTFHIGVNYAIPISYGRIDLNMNYAYMSSWAQGPDNILKSPASNLINTQIGWTLPDDKTQLTFWAKNLTDQAVPMFLQTAANAGGYSEQVNQPPRTFGFTVQYDF